MTKLTTVVHHELDEQLFFTWLWCGYHDLIRQAHIFTIDLDKRLKQEQSPLLGYHQAGRHLWRAITRLPRQLDSKNNHESTDLTLTRLTKKAPLFLLIYQGLWLENRLVYAQQAATGAMLFYFYYEQATIGHTRFIALHTQLSEWIYTSIHQQMIHETQVQSLILFYFHDYTAKTIQQHQTLPQPPMITLLQNELFALYEDSQKNQPKMFGNFSETALETVSAICPNQRQNPFLMAFFDAIARAYVYTICRNSMEQMLACEKGMLLKFLCMPVLVGVALITSLFFNGNMPLVLLQYSLLYVLIRFVRFFFHSHAFDHYYNARELVSYLDCWTPVHSEEGFRYWSQTLKLDTTALLPPETPSPQKMAQKPATPEYWYPGNYTRVIYRHLRALAPISAPIIHQKITPETEILTWTIDGLTYSNEPHNHTTHAFAIDQPNLSAKSPTAYYAAIHPKMTERSDTQNFQHLLKGRLRFVGDTGGGVKRLKKDLFELKTVGDEGKNDARMLSDPQPYSAKERSTARLLLFSRAPMNHAQVKNHLSLPIVSR